MDIQIRKQLEQLEYIKDKLEYIEYSESLQCYVEKLNGIPTGVAAWVNGAFYGFEQAKANESKKLDGCVMDIQKEREAFESWFESRYGANFMQFALALGFYVDKHTQTCWEAWQAAKAQASSEWISVKNAMPKAGSYVLTYDDYGFATVEKIDGCEDTNNVYFSHWLPLPEPPVKQEPAND